MLGFFVVNLLIPNDPDEINIKTISGSWTINKYGNFAQSITAIANGQCAHTYTIENDISMAAGAAACDARFNEMTPILLGASYVSGLSVTVKNSLPHSDCMILQPSSHWPRERAMGVGNYCLSDQTEFIDILEKFVATWPLKAASEKILILIHHWLDALGCWSFEDFYLSATTLLQIIAATEEQITGNPDLSYFRAIQSASARVGIGSLSRDFKDMRNNLIHEGKLLGGSFAGGDIQACSKVAADLMNWFDNYIHSVLNLGPVKKQRFTAGDFISLNAYSID